jgi:ectoine hydroxylase-related dioxygenase (phytanoyl-CoA dioxygenase family)
VLAFAVWIGYWGVCSFNSAKTLQVKWHGALPLGLAALASLAAAWFAVEDVRLDSGPLFYYVG